MLSGVLIGRSAQAGSELNGVPLRILDVRQVEVTDPASGPPGRWTVLEFQAEEHRAGRLADALADCLDPDGGWYAQYLTAEEAFVVFPGRVFRHPHDDTAARARARAYGRSVGVPEVHLEWAD